MVGLMKQNGFLGFYVREDRLPDHFAGVGKPGFAVNKARRPSPPVGGCDLYKARLIEKLKASDLGIPVRWEFKLIFADVLFRAFENVELPEDIKALARFKSLALFQPDDGT